MKVKLFLVGVLVSFVALIGCTTAEKKALLDVAERYLNVKVEEMKEKILVINYIVKKGDCLWDISSSQYGDPFLWTAIYRNNRDVIGNNPDLIEIDDEYKIKYNYSGDEYSNFKQKAYEYGK